MNTIVSLSVLIILLVIAIGILWALLKESLAEKIFWKKEYHLVMERLQYELTNNRKNQSNPIRSKTSSKRSN